MQKTKKKKKRGESAKETSQRREKKESKGNGAWRDVEKIAARKLGKSLLRFVLKGSAGPKKK